MCHSRTLNNKINRIHERALRRVYNDYKSNFKELLERDHSFTIHEGNIQYLAIEAYTVKDGLSSFIVNIFQFGKNSAYELSFKLMIFKEQITTLYILAGAN